MNSESSKTTNRISNPYAKRAASTTGASSSATMTSIHAIASQLKGDATIRGRNSAMKCFHKFQADTNVDLFSDLNEAEDVEAKGEAAISYILNFSLWLKKNPVEAQEKDKALTNDTIGQYFGQVKEVIRESTSTLKIWNNHEDECYSQLLHSVKSAYSSNILEGELPVRDPTCRSIHLQCSEGRLMQLQREWIDSQGASIDSILKKLIEGEFNNSNCHEERLKILLVYYMVGRGGELKFLRHDLNIWDYYANSLQSIVTRLKTRTQHPFWIQCVPFSESCYRIDFLHAFGCWAAVGDGLFCINPNANGAKFWFPSMRNQRNEKVARDITTLVKKYVAKCMIPSTSSRGIQVGANTELAMSINISNEEQRQATGHSAGTNTELYVRMNPDLGIPASLCLSLWENPRKIAVPPTLDALQLSQEEVETLMDSLFTVSLNMFKKRGFMRVLLRHCAASIIMYHPSFVKDYDASYFKLPRKLLQAIEDGGFANKDSASSKLFEWADLIQQRFLNDNNLLSNNDEATLMTMNQTINNQSILINKLLMKEGKQSSVIASLERKIENLKHDRKRDFQTMQQSIDLLTKQHETSIKILMQLGHQTDEFITHSEERCGTSRKFNLDSESPATLPRKDLTKDLEKVDGDNTATGTTEGREKNRTVALPWSLFIEHIQKYIPKDTALDRLTWNQYADIKSN